MDAVLHALTRQVHQTSHSYLGAPPHNCLGSDGVAAMPAPRGGGMVGNGGSGGGGIGNGGGAILGGVGSFAEEFSARRTRCTSPWSHREGESSQQEVRGVTAIPCKQA